MKKTFQFSSTLVGGYQVRVDLDTVKTVKDIEQICTAKMLQSLVNNNLIEMLSKVDGEVFRIHDLTIEDIKSSKQKVFYICKCSSVS
jgi:SHS2 domain-containing protein